MQSKAADLRALDPAHVELSAVAQPEHRPEVSIAALTQPVLTAELVHLHVRAWHIESMMRADGQARVRAQRVIERARADMLQPDLGGEHRRVVREPQNPRVARGCDRCLHRACQEHLAGALFGAPLPSHRGPQLAHVRRGLAVTVGRGRAARKDLIPAARPVVVHAREHRRAVGRNARVLPQDVAVDHLVDQAKDLGAGVGQDEHPAHEREAEQASPPTVSQQLTQWS